MADWIRRFAHHPLPQDVFEHLQQFQSSDDAFAKSNDGACLLWLAAAAAVTEPQKLAVRVAAAQVEAVAVATLINPRNRTSTLLPDATLEAYRDHLAACRAAAFAGTDRWIPASFVPQPVTNNVNNAGEKQQYLAAGAELRASAAETLRTHTLLASLREEGLRG